MHSVFGRKFGEIVAFFENFFEVGKLVFREVLLKLNLILLRSVAIGFRDFEVDVEGRLGLESFADWSSVGGLELEEELVDSGGGNWAFDF